VTAPPVIAAVRLKPVTAAELPRVLEIEQDAFSTPWKASTFAGLLRRDDTDLLGAELDGRLVGYAVCWTVVDQSELGNLAVAREARGRGVGRTLLGAMLGRLAGRGARECFLEVRVSNLAAQSLYRSLGFVTVGSRPRYYTLPTEDALVMRRSIPRPA
jgi:ribosomal-protein-alanine N-acetyltransferase